MAIGSGRRLPPLAWLSHFQKHMYYGWNMLSRLKEFAKAEMQRRGRCIGIYPLAQYFMQFDIDCVLDVGANIGQTGTELRSLGYRGHIASFEPQSKECEILRSIAAKDHSWSVFQFGLGSESGLKTLNISGKGPSSSFLDLSDEALSSNPDLKYVDTEQVRTHRLDDVFEQVTKGHKRVYLKIDTQGFESEVLEGASGVIDRVLGVQLEISLIPQYDGEVVAEEMISRVRSLGFTPFWFLPGHRNFLTQQLYQLDMIAFRQSKIAMNIGVDPNALPDVKNSIRTRSV